LLLSGIVYGSLSVYESFREHRGAASIIGWCLAVPMTLLFLFFLLLTFWDVLPLA
jgi:hypothetical protein